MALPLLLFNASTGSDTAASGAGPSTALTGTGASLAASTSVDLSADSPNLSGVAVDGSACLWVLTSSGRQYSKITAADNTTKVVTVETAYAVTEGSRAWAIGGKRATWNATTSRTLFNDARPGWEIRTETDQTLTSGILISSNSGDSTIGRIVASGASNNPRPVINITANASSFTFSSSNNWRFTKLQFTCSNGTKTSARAFNAGSSTSGYVIDDCILGDPTGTNNILEAFNSNSGSNLFLDCEIVNCTGFGVNVTNSSGNPLHVRGCWIHNCALGGITCASALQVSHTLISDCGGDGINRGNVSANAIITNCTIDGNAGDGLDLSGNTGASSGLVLENNIFSNNGGYGVRGSSATDAAKLFCDYNNFFNNTSGPATSYTLGAHDLQVDPGYANAAIDNYAPGVNLKALGFPGAARTMGAGRSGTTSYVDIGGAQRQEASGGGGSSVIGSSIIRPGGRTQ